MDQEMSYVFAVYEHGSFSKAAEALYITQPALSMAVRRVEERLGMPLFDRVSRPLRLTEAGELYIEKYRRMQDLENELERQINDLSSLQRGSLHLGGSHFINSYILPPVLTEFSRSYPGIRLELTEAGPSELAEMLAGHRIDLTVNCDVAPGETFRREPCFTDHVLLAVPPGLEVNERLAGAALTAGDVLRGVHGSDEAEAVSLGEFAELPFILLTPGNDLLSRSLEFFEKENMQPRVRLHVTQLATAWHLAQAGMGAAFISDRIIRSEGGNMRFYKIDSPRARRVFDLVMPEGRYVTNAMRAFMELACRLCG